MAVPGFVKEQIRSALGAYYASLLAGGVRAEYEYIFILSHMRAGSSLLTEVLTSHTAICGYGETHIEYSKGADLRRLTWKVLATKRRFPGLGGERYILDKLLHNSLLRGRGSEVWRTGRVRPVFLVRDPASTIRSMYRSFGWKECAVRAYYPSRLNELSEILIAICGSLRPIVITYEELTSRPQRTLQALQWYLNVEEPFAETYPVGRQTGVKGVGDTSEMIRSGRILKGEGRSDDVADVGATTWADIEGAYDRFWKVSSRVNVQRAL